MIILLVIAASICLAKALKVWRIDLQSYGFLIVLTALLHLGFMYLYYDQFAPTRDWFYLLVAATCMTFLILGVWLGEKWAAGIRWSWWRHSRSGEVLGNLHNAILGFVLLISVLNLVSYVRNTGSLNPLIGLQHYLSGANSAGEMWASSGALRYGDGRGGEEGGSFLAYLLSRFSMLIYLLLGILKPYAFAVGAGAYFMTDLLALSVGYFSRTTVLLRAGLLALYSDARIHKFRPFALIALLFTGLVIFLVLHLGRIGELVQSGGSIGSKASMVSLETAAVGTFEPIGFAFKYYAAFGPNSLEENIEHFCSYIGAIVPRVLWPDKPFYAFEPDLTMKLTQENIGGVNVVRTFSIIGEGLMIGGVWGVALISLLYGVLTSFTLTFLGQRKEFVVVRIYLLLMFTLGFRLSLFTIWTSTYILGLLPLAVAWFVFHLISGSNSATRGGIGVQNRARNSK